MEYKIEFKITNDLDEVCLTDSTFLTTDNISSAEDSFYRILRHFETYLKALQIKEEEIDQEIKRLKLEEQNI